MKCYNCGKLEELSGDEDNRFSDIDRIETDLLDYSDEEEKFMPLCQQCLREWQDGKLPDIESRWIEEQKKWEYISIAD